MTTETITQSAPPATFEQRAFRNLSVFAGIPPIRLLLDGQIASAQSEKRNPNLADIDLGIAGADNSRKVYLELIRLLQAGLPREQLIDILQWGAIQAHRAMEEQRAERKSHEIDVRLDYKAACRLNSNLVPVECIDIEEAEFIAQGGEKREEGARS